MAASPKRRSGCNSRRGCSEVQLGKSPELEAMAQKIIEDQRKEIAHFDQWLAKHK